MSIFYRYILKYICHIYIYVKRKNTTTIPTKKNKKVEVNLVLPIGVNSDLYYFNIDNVFIRLNKLIKKEKQLAKYPCSLSPNINSG